MVKSCTICSSHLSNKREPLNTMNDLLNYGQC